MAETNVVRDNAIYFPYINVPYDAWLVRMLLYWDKVCSVVPEDHLQDPGRLEPVMRDLVSAGLVEQLVPVKYAGEIEGLAVPFLAYVKKEVEASRGRGRAHVTATRPRTTLLHMEKIGSISDSLVGLGVARVERYPWFEVETWAADAFMFLLTSMLGQLADVAAVPVTNESGARVVGPGTIAGRAIGAGRLAKARAERISPRPVTSDSRPVSPCSEQPTKEET